jgi:ATP-dependent DNA helicase RecQ
MNSEPTLQVLLKQHFGFTEFRPGQAAVIQALLECKAALADLDTASFHALRAQHPNALGHPRQTARFLCGLNSPALTKAKLTRHALFGVFEDRRFAHVLAWCVIQ